MLRNNSRLLVDKILSMFIRSGQPSLIKLVLRISSISKGLSKLIGSMISNDTHDYNMVYWVPFLLIQLEEKKKKKKIDKLKLEYMKSLNLISNKQNSGFLFLNPENSRGFCTLMLFAENIMENIGAFDFA